MNAVQGGMEKTALFLVVGALALYTGCGSDDKDDAAADGHDTAVSTVTDSKPTASGEDEEQIRTLFTAMTKAIATRDATAACPLMARSGQRTFVMLVESGPRTCERGFDLAFAKGTDEARSPELVRVEVQGSRATVFARASTSKGLQRAPFVKESGEWKVESWLTD